ncbi:MAG TPA: threonine synthase [Dehalococcoidia bacterium]|mgnify:FL=1|nr:threonine synthase [Chloroflexota bacterium]MDP5876066.1 threonine synthase [Dehalococcoidia bacterium]MDP6274430.1 threonine synthase [Dehalococcoidia bacterium]MDP7160634.1 threonine synthase [Dehalococcoidia bacterium]MDP7213680.1 threonine synthase [Dehalococcoidia bacterium]
MAYASALHCRECGNEYPIAPIHVCEWCFGPLEITYDYDAIKSAISREKIKDGPLTMWRYADLLPVSSENAVDIGTGMTPLLRADNLGRELGIDNLWIKNDAVNPTYSFKDRVVSIAATKALEFGFDTLACASTGNLAGAVAAHGAKANMRTLVFIPSDLERGKVIGAAIYGPTVVAVDGNYDDVNRLCSELADANESWAFVNINMRPYYSEGSKTLGYEVVEQLDWEAPDHAVVPIASGSLFTKIWKGMNEFASLGLIDDVRTKMHGAQADGCSPVAQAFADEQLHVKPIVPDTIAKSLAIGNPADAYYTLKITQEAEGSTVGSTPDPEIVEGIKMLAQTEGIFTETAGGVVISNLKKLAEAGRFQKGESVVAFITGNGLKTIEAVQHLANPVSIGTTVSSFEEAVPADAERGQQVGSRAASS